MAGSFSFKPRLPESWRRKRERKGKKSALFAVPHRYRFQVISACFKKE